MKMHMKIAALAIAALTVAGLAGCRDGSTTTTAAAAPRPTVTVTVTADPISTGVDQSTYEACQQAYHQVVSLLSKQTTILQGVSFAARDGFTAVADGDVAGLQAATSKVSDLSSQETDLTGEVQGMDSSACQ